MNVKKQVYAVANTVTGQEVYHYNSPRQESPMTIGESILPEFEMEMAGTRKGVDRVPAD